MISTCILHDDYEYFANYLGIDYEDFVNMQYGLPDEDEIETEQFVIV